MVLVGGEPRHPLAAHLEARHAVGDALLRLGQQRGERRPHGLEGRPLRLGHGREVVVHVLRRHVGHPFLSCPCSMPVTADSGTAAAGGAGLPTEAGGALLGRWSPIWSARPRPDRATGSPSSPPRSPPPAWRRQCTSRRCADSTDLTGLVPVEYPTTRLVGADPRARAADLNAAFARPRHPCRARHHRRRGPDHRRPAPRTPTSCAPTPSRSSATATTPTSCRWLWTQGVAGFYGGSTQVQLGAGPGVDACHARVVAGGAAHRRAPRGGRARRVGGLRHRLGGPARR